MKLDPLTLSAPGPKPVRSMAVGGAIGASRGPSPAVGFTLLEMLVVLAIIGIVAAMTLPSFKKMGRGSVIDTSTRQLVDDLAQARLKAISGRTRVYVVFFPRQSFYLPVAQSNAFMNMPAAGTVLGGQMASYALFTRHTVGDQPGEENPRYLSEWHSLPDGVMFPHGIFTNINASGRIFWNVNRLWSPVPATQDYLFLWPDSGASNSFYLPYIAFEPDGRVFGRSTDLVIPIVEGSLIHAKDVTGQTNLVTDVDWTETAPGVTSGSVREGVEYLVAGSGSLRYPPGGTQYRAGEIFMGGTNANYGNVIGLPRVTELYGVRVNWLTGRAKVVRPEIQ